MSGAASRAMIATHRPRTEFDFFIDAFPGKNGTTGGQTVASWRKNGQRSLAVLAARSCVLVAKKSRSNRLQLPWRLLQHFTAGRRDLLDADSSHGDVVGL